MTDLRSALGAKQESEFDLTLPPGWARHPVGDEALDHLLSGLRDRLMKAQQPQLFAELKPVVKQAFDGMKRDGAFAYFAATDEAPGTLWIPASIIATVRRAEPGATLDPLVTKLIAEQGATPLRGDKSTLRLERERTVQLGGATLVNRSVIYLTPMPGSGRRRALQLVAGFGRSVDTSPEDDYVKGITFLLDTCVASLRWRSS